MTVQNVSTALFVDTCSRGLMVHTVSVTEVPERGLVLRFGTTLGPLWQLTQNGELRPELPILVGATGYSAQSSAGFVEVVARHPTHHQNVVGIQGMPWQKGKKSLRTADFGVWVLRPGTNVMRAQTHAAGSAYSTGGHSNPATAEAALAGLRLRVQTNPNEVIVAEGQSDYTTGYRLVGYHNIYQDVWEPQWPGEHRATMFTEQSLFEHRMRAYTRSRFSRDTEVTPGMLVGATLINMARLQVMPQLFENTGFYPHHKEFAATAFEAKKAQGWSLRVNASGANHFLQAINPDGEMVVQGWGLCHLPKEAELAMYGFVTNPESELEAMRQSLAAQDDESRAWVSHIGA